MPAPSGSFPSAEWPGHWPRPAAEDLEFLQAAYDRGIVPPHSAILNQSMPPAEVGSAACNATVDALFAAAARERDAGQPIVGLAAPQIGIEAQVVLFDPTPEVPLGQAATNLLCVINPSLKPAGEMLDSPEGCLSTGLFRGLVRRFGSVLLSGFRPDGTEIIDAPYEGLAARALQHEVWGHLRGQRVPDEVPDSRLLWVANQDRPAFYRHITAVLAGEAALDWQLAPRDQWWALRSGTPVFGGPAGGARGV